MDHHNLLFNYKKNSNKSNKVIKSNIWNFKDQQKSIE